MDLDRPPAMVDKLPVESVEMRHKEYGKSN